MTGNRYLLDTNVISAWLEDDVGIADRIENATQVFIAVIVIGEMYYGAHYSTKVKDNIENILKVLLLYPVLAVDENTCTYYGSIKASLRKNRYLRMIFGSLLSLCNMILH